MNENSEDSYFRWLRSLVGSTRNGNPERTYSLLFEQMHNKPFRWFVPNDDNRLADGAGLREEYFGEIDRRYEPSFLEVLIGLCHRASFESDAETSEWMGEFLRNMGLDEWNDSFYMDHDPDHVDVIMTRVINREYDIDGRGGLFPLDDPMYNQREVELWYQMSAYLLEGKGP